MTAVRGKLVKRLAAIREVATDRKQAVMKQELATLLREIAFSATRIRCLEPLSAEIGGIGEAAESVTSSLEELPASVNDLVADLNRVKRTINLVRHADGAACQALLDRCRTLADLALKLQVEVPLRALDQERLALQVLALQLGPLGSQLAEIQQKAIIVRKLVADTQQRVLNTAQESFGRHVGLEQARQLLGDGLPVTEIDMAVLNRLLRSRLAENLVLRIK